ncbi:MAG: nucleotidyltransferase family protein [Gammaproteobacteria bacterium]|nr:nucleotidyltransferase family protein [Gammaproteobacteria bacterium]MCL5255835.1 nucleotidyltransferase family protein [Gammaproteobacteria bacterium]
MTVSACTAMILAAGRGERMRPVTDSLPKPLLSVAGKPLIVWHLEKLAAIGVTDVVINTAWLPDVLVEHLGDGANWGLAIHWSHEPAGGLETAGGVLQALPLLGDTPFYLVNGDVFSDYDYAHLPTTLNDKLGHLVLVENPEHNPLGDFCLDSSHNVKPRTGNKSGLTFSGLSVLHPQLFAPWLGYIGKRLPLREVFLPELERGGLVGEHYAGLWTDVGTPERLQQLNQLLAANSAGSSNSSAAPVRG